MVPHTDHAQQTPLSVSVKDIPPEGFKMDCEVNPEWLELPSDDGKVQGNFHWVGTVISLDEGATVSGTLSGVMVRECVRCLQDFKDPISISCMAVFQLPESESRQTQKSDQKSVIHDPLETIGDDLYPFDGNQVEVGKMLREQVILTSPFQPLCRPDCLGLCQRCGRNLNQGRCGCAERDALLQQGTIRFRVGKAKTN